MQVIIFVKSVQRCIALSQLLVEQNFPAIAIHRSMPQEERCVIWYESERQASSLILDIGTIAITLERLDVDLENTMTKCSIG